MKESVLFVGFNAWLIFVFLHQIRFMLLKGAFWKKKIEAGNKDGLTLYRVGVTIITILNYFGIFGYVAFVMAYPPLLDSYFAVIGIAGGSVLFFLSNWLVDRKGSVG